MNLGTYAAHERDQQCAEREDRLAANRQFLAQWHAKADELGQMLRDGLITPEEYSRRIYEAGSRQ